jgi:hypothetical protein
MAEGQSSKLHAEQPTCDMLLEVGQRCEHGRAVGLAEKDASERARVEVDPAH